MERLKIFHFFTAELAYAYRLLRQSSFQKLNIFNLFCMDKMHKFTKILLAVAWFLLVFRLVTMPMPSYPEAIEQITFFDKLVHFIMFGVLFYFIANAVIKKDFSNWRRAIYPAFLFSFLFSFFTEYLQAYLPSRTSSLYDTIGGVAGVIIFSLAFYKIKKPKKPKLLLHICCVGCGAFVSSELKKDYKVSLYYSNSNIFPETEYEKRREEAVRIAKKFRLPIFFSPYDHKKWLKAVRGLEKEKERGKRCLVCYRLRLTDTIKKAKELGFEYFTTTLTISPHKEAKAIIETGGKLEKKHGVKFLARDFKKNDGYKKSTAMSRKLNLYRQNYCGCEFSIRPK